MSLYDDPKKWAELAARLYDEKADKKTSQKARANLARRRGLDQPPKRGGLSSLPPAALPSPASRLVPQQPPPEPEPEPPDTIPDEEEAENTRPLPEVEFEHASDPLNEAEDDDPTDVRIPGMDRPRGTHDELIEPAPGDCIAHLIDEDAEEGAAAHAIPPDCTEFVIGRARSCQLQVRVDGEISRKHARITRRRDRFIIEDLDSRNGTLVNGELVESRRLFGGELIQVGLSRFRFVLVDA